MSAGTVLTMGLGSFGTVNFLPTLGFGDYGVTPTPPVYPHGGGYVTKRDRKRTKKRDKEYREARERLREQIRFAIEGPRAEEIREELEEIAIPQKADSVYVALVDRIDIEALIARASLMVRIEQAARMAALEDDDEEVLSLFARLQ